MTTADNAISPEDRLRIIRQYYPKAEIKPEYEPIGVTPRHKPPRGSFDPDTSKSWFWRVFPILRAHKLLVLTSLSTSFAGMLIGIFIPALTASVIDDALLGEATADRVQLAIRGMAHMIDAAFLPEAGVLMAYFSLIIGIGLVQGIVSFISAYTHSRLTYCIDYDLRTIIYAHLTKLPFSFFDKIQSGQLISRSNSDIQAVEWFLTGAPDIFRAFVMVSLALTYMLSMHIWLTLLAMVTLPAVYILSSRMRRVMYPLSWLNQSRVAEVTTIADENINGVRVVKSFAAEKRQIKLFADAAESLRWARIQEIKLSATFMPLIGALPTVGLTLILLYGGYLVMVGDLSIGSLLAFNSYVMMVSMPARQFAMLLMQYERARASARRIYEILDEKSDIVDSADAVDLPVPKGKIEFRNVDFSYRDGTEILKNFNLLIEPGDAIAIVGRTGSGKSTLTRLLARFYDVSNGAVLIDGKDVRDVTLASLRHGIGMVLDEPFLFSTSVRENIAYGRPEATMEDVVKAARAASAHTFIQALPEGYESVVGERGYTLSGGQRQRIAIARTLLLNPGILVLDDATSSIDVQVEEEIHKTMRKLMKDRTTIVIAHRVSTILLADRVVLVEGGQIAASGTHAELMAKEPRYVEVLARAEEAEKERESVRLGRTR